MDKTLQQHYKRADTEQSRLKKIYDAQQTDIGQASLKVQKELADKMRSKGINVPLQEVGCITNIKTGEKQYYLKR